MKIKKSSLPKGFVIILCLSLLSILFIGNIFDIMDVIATTYDSTNPFTDDFNDNDYSNKWDLGNFNDVGIIENDNGYIKLNFSSANTGFIGLNSQVEDMITYENITIQLDKMFITQNGGQYAYFGLGSSNSWTPNIVYFEYGTDYGGVLHIFAYNSSGRIMLYNMGGNPNFAQMKITVFSLNKSMSFYQNNIKLGNYPMPWFWDIYDNTCYMTFGLTYNMIGVSEIIYDNFISYYGEPNNIKVLLKPSHHEFMGAMFPDSNIYGTIDKELNYIVDWNLSVYCKSSSSGINVTKWMYINSTDEYIINNNIGYIKLSDVTNISIELNLLPNWFIVDLISIGFNIDIRVSYYPPYWYINSVPYDYGLKCFPNNTYIALYEDERIIQPQNVTPIFDYWKIYDNESTLLNTVYNDNLQLLIYNNITIEVYSHVPYINNSWWMRSADFMDTTPPVPPMAGYYFHQMLDELVMRNNGTNAINYIQLRASYYFNTTENRFKICDKVRYFINDSFIGIGNPENARIQNPLYLWDDYSQGIIGMDMNQLQLAVDMIHTHGFKVYIVIQQTVSGNSNYPPNFDWSSIVDVRNMVKDVGIDVIIPFSNHMQSWDVEDYCLSIEWSQGTNFGLTVLPNSDYYNPPYGEYILTSCNDIWNDIIYDIRTRYSGRLTQMITGMYTYEDFEVIKKATYIKNLDYLTCDLWWVIQTNSTVFSAKDMAVGWFNSYDHANMIALLNDYCSNISKQIIINQGYPNRFGGLSSPWSTYGTYNWRDDVTQYNAWRGSIWALQGLGWFGGFDFESYTKTYGNNLQTDNNYASGVYANDSIGISWRFNNFTQDMIIDEINRMNIPDTQPPTPLTLADMNITEDMFIININDNVYRFDYSHYPDSESMTIYKNKINTFYITCFNNSVLFDANISAIYNYGKMGSFDTGYYQIDNDGVWYTYILQNQLPISNNYMILYKMSINNVIYDIGNQTYKIISGVTIPDENFIIGGYDILDILFNNIGIFMIMIIPSLICMWTINNPIGFFGMMNLITYLNFKSGMWDITYFLFTVFLTLLFTIMILFGGI